MQFYSYYNFDSSFVFRGRGLLKTSVVDECECVLYIPPIRS